jgi:hypothetical protein
LRIAPALIEADQIAAANGLRRLSLCRTGEAGKRNQI